MSISVKKEDNPQTDPSPYGMTFRALFTGLILAFAVGAVVPYLSLYIQGSNASAYFTSQIAHLCLFVLILVVNGVLGNLRRSWAFGRGELVVIFIMASLANAVPGLLGYWLPLVSSPFYYATPENNWNNLFNPYIPSWLVPHDLGAIRGFFEGSGDESTAIPWQVWLVPLLSWLPLVVALQTATLCMMVIVRRQWVDQERLIYPVMQLPLAMVQDETRGAHSADERGALFKPFFRNGVMWIGFSVPVIVGTIIGLHAYFPYFPTIDLSVPLPYLSGRISFATLGFFFLIQREVAFGLWVFTLVNNLQGALYHAIGWGIEKETVVSVWSYGLASLVHQGMGAMIVLVLGGLWVGREHLANVFNKAFGRAPEVDDSDEIISYRGAVFGLLGSTATLVLWLWYLGMPLVGVMTLLFFIFVVYMAITRVVVEGGVAVIYAPLVVPDAAISAIGTAYFGPAGLVGLAYSRVFANDLLNFTMPHVANGLKLSGQIEGRRRLLFWGMLLAILVGIAGAMWMLLGLAYKYGAINLRPPNFIWLPNYVGDYTAARISNPAAPSGLGWFHTGIGSAVMGLLMLARRLWVWWPLHPIGFPISSTFNWMAFNAFMAWAIKGPILRYGGVRLYRQIRPFFLGMIMGHFAIFGVFWVIDAFTGMVGNSLFL